MVNTKVRFPGAHLSFVEWYIDIACACFGIGFSTTAYKLSSQLYHTHEGRSHHLRIVVDDTFLVACFSSALSTSVASLSRWHLIYLKPLIYEPIPELAINNKGCVVLTHHSYSYNVFHESPFIDLAAYECGFWRPCSKPYKQTSDRLKAIRS